MPEVRFSCFVHYLGEVVGWQLGKWDLGGNSFCCECKYSCDKGLGRGIFLEKLGGAEFCCAGGRENSEFRIVNSERGGGRQVNFEG